MSDGRSAPPVVWVVPSYPWSGDGVSGIFYRNQCAALARAGLDITVVAPAPWVPGPLARLRPKWALYRASPPQEHTTDGVRVLRPRYPAAPRDSRLLFPDRAIAWAAWRTRHQWHGRAELVHGHFSVTGVAARRLALRAGLPYVLTVHGDDVNTWPDQRPEWKAPLVAALRDAAVVFAVSAALAKRVAELAGVEATTLPLGIDHGAFRRAAGDDRAVARAALGLPDDAVVALFVGHLQAAKGIREFVEGVTRAGPPVVGLVVGGGPERRSLQARGAKRIQWMGVRSNTEVARIMLAADVLVLPSWGEGLPTVVVEAGSVGLPVIASRVGGIPELLGDQRGLLLDEISATAVTAAIRQMSNDHVAARAMGDALRRHVEEAYDVDRNARRMLAVYATTLASGSVRTRGRREE